MLSNMTETTQKIFKAKIEEIELKIKQAEEELDNNQQVVLDKER